jgi:hypothetical protein
MAANLRTDPAIHVGHCAIGDTDAVPQTIRRVREWFSRAERELANE